MGRTLAPSPLAQEILKGDHDAELEQIDLAIRNRKRMMFRPGSKVRLVGTRNPTIDGQIGTVIKVNPKRISVGLGEKGQFGYEQEYLVPVGMLEAV